MTEYPLPPNAMPHSVLLDEAGFVWYTGNKNGTLGRLDPASGTITEYKMPDPAAEDPHTAVFDQDGILWFTLQQSNMVGRLDPASGAIRLATAPTPGAKPYGIKIAADGTPYVACNGSNCLLRVDPQTLALTRIDLPTPGTTVRRLDIAADGTIWYVNSGQGRLGRYDPKTGEIKEWPSPSGPELPPLRARRGRRHRLVQRVGQAPGRAGAFRPGERNLPELADPVGRRLRRHHPPHAPHQGRQPLDPPEQHQPHHPGDAEPRFDDAVARGLAAATAAQRDAGSPPARADTGARQRVPDCGRRVSCSGRLQRGVQYEARRRRGRRPGVAAPQR